MKKLSEKTTIIHHFLLLNIEKHPDDLTRITADEFGISKQAIRKHIQELVNKGYVSVSGATRDRKYKLVILQDIEKKIPITPEITEDILWRQEISPKLDGVDRHIINICQYGFTEMVNNVIDHSEGNFLQISLERTAAYLKLQISDDGIGIFNKISKILGLTEKIQVILELAKGKLTTDPKHHTGEGIFFTSRAFDEFMLVSDNLVFAHTETDNDWLLEEQENIYKGTFVSLKIAINSKRVLKDVFDKYADSEEYGFSKTFIPVTLARYGEENLVSRSQAKRLLVRFERFKEIILDFKGVEIIGQAFADEIFRVFTIDHPSVRIRYISANDQVKKMIERAKYNLETRT